MDIRYFDIHGHINFDQYDQDREQTIQRAKDGGVGMIVVGTDVESSKKAIQLAESHEGIWASIGIHPTDTHELIDFSEFHRLAQHPKVVAIGECGLDYFHSKPEDIPKQREIFEKHIALANEVNKPLMLHVRNGASTEHNAYTEAISMLQNSKVRANFHFFAGTIEDMQQIVAMNNMISATGVLTFARNYDEVIKSVPLTHLMSETDCPFVSPVPYRGKRNEPSYVIEIVKKIAEIRGEQLDVVAQQLVRTATKFFQI